MTSVDLKASVTNSNNIDIADFEKKVSPERLFKLTDFIVNGTITGTTAKPVLEEMFHTGTDADAILPQQGLSQISAPATLAAEILEVINRSRPERSDVAYVK